MGKLTQLSGRLSVLPQTVTQLRLGTENGDREAWRAWYRTARWAKLRHEVFLRNGYLCQRTGTLCIGKHPAPNSPVANHKVPHRGDPELFWDIDNLETVSKQVHDGLIQHEEQSMPAGRWR